MLHEYQWSLYKIWLNTELCRVEYNIYKWNANSMIGKYKTYG